MGNFRDVEAVAQLIKDAYELGWADSKKYAGDKVEASVKWDIRNGIATPIITPRQL